MPNTVFQNVVLESKLNDLLNTKLPARSFMKIDTDLAESAGMTKTINVYTYTPSVEEVTQGDGVTTQSTIAYSPVSYTVKLYQQEFTYYDEEYMKDPKIVDMGVAGGADAMANDLNTKFFAELQKASLKQGYTSGSITYDVIVDAISLMNLEDESGLFVIIGTDLKAALRKDSDFTSARQGEIIFNGQIGSIAGIPVVVSKLVPANVAYIADRNAVTMFVKKDSEVEQERDATKRANKVIMRKVGLVSLTDASKAVAVLPYIAAPVITTASIAQGSNKTFAGTCVAGATITIYVDGAPLKVGTPAVVQKATVTDTNWTYTIATATAGEAYSVVASKANFYDKASANAITAA